MGLLDDIRKNLMGGYDLPEMRLESLLWVRIPILGLFYASEAKQIWVPDWVFSQEIGKKIL